MEVYVVLRLVEEGHAIDVDYPIVGVFTTADKAEQVIEDEFKELVERGEANEDDCPEDYFASEQKLLDEV